MSLAEGCVTTQEQFDAQFITSMELCTVLGVQRATVLNLIKSCRVPKPIVIKSASGAVTLTLWNRAEMQRLIPVLKHEINSRKGVPA